MSEVISVRIKRELAKEIDSLVSQGLFSSRNEALNYLIQVGLKEFEKWKEDIVKSKEVKLPLINKTLEDFLSERDRY